MSFSLYKFIILQPWVKHLRSKRKLRVEFNFNLNSKGSRVYPGFELQYLQTSGSRDFVIMENDNFGNIYVLQTFISVLFGAQ